MDPLTLSGGLGGTGLRGGMPGHRYISININVHYVNICIYTCMHICIHYILDTGIYE